MESHHQSTLEQQQQQQQENPTSSRKRMDSASINMSTLYCNILCIQQQQPRRLRPRTKQQQQSRQREAMVNILLPSSSTVKQSRHAPFLFLLTTRIITTMMMMMTMMTTTTTITTADAFVTQSPPKATTMTATTAAANKNRMIQQHYPLSPCTSICTTSSSTGTSTTALNVWWFGGTESDSTSSAGGNDGDSCELVAVRIERTSPNSRKIAGDIVVPVAIDQVWQILTDYSRLAIHVPNLVESKIVRELPSQRRGTGGRIADVVQGAVGGLTSASSPRPGDGSYRCRLYQKGAQKIIGFDFSASVTMDMTERIVVPPPPPPPPTPTQQSSESDDQKLQPQRQMRQQQRPVSPPQERKINFKCVDSQFFTEFDGDWTVKEQFNTVTNQMETLCSYVVDVRPKGPVPVAALEWRIREDVPSNLRAVKAAAMLLSTENAGSKSALVESTNPSNIVTIDSARAAMGRAVQRVTTNAKNGSQRTSRRLAPVPVLNDWEKDETMAKYL